MEATVAQSPVRCQSGSHSERRVLRCSAIKTLYRVSRCLPNLVTTLITSTNPVVLPLLQPMFLTTYEPINYAAASSHLQTHHSSGVQTELLTFAMSGLSC